MIASSSLVRGTASSVALKRKLVSYDLTDSSDSDEEAENNISTVFVLSASPALAAAAVPVPAVKTSASNKVDETALTTVLTFGKTADCPKTEDHSDEQLHQTSPALADKAPNLEALSLKEGGKEKKEGEKPKKKSKRGPASPPPETAAAAASTAQGGSSGSTSSSVNLSCSSDWPMSEPMPDGDGSSGNSAGNREGNGKGNGKGSGKGKDTAKDKDKNDDELDFKSSNWLKMAASLPPTYSVSQVGVSFFRSFFLSFFLCVSALFFAAAPVLLLVFLQLLLLLLPLIALLFLFLSLPFPSIYQRLLSVLCFVPFSSQSVSQSVSQLLINRSYTSPIFPLSLSCFLSY